MIPYNVFRLTSTPACYSGGPLLTTLLRRTRSRDRPPHSWSTTPGVLPGLCRPGPKTHLPCRRPSISTTGCVRLPSSRSLIQPEKCVTKKKKGTSIPTPSLPRVRYKTLLVLSYLVKGLEPPKGPCHSGSLDCVPENGSLYLKDSPLTCPSSLRKVVFDISRTGPDVRSLPRRRGPQIVSGPRRSLWVS